MSGLSLDRLGWSRHPDRVERIVIERSILLDPEHRAEVARRLELAELMRADAETRSTLPLEGGE